jgi:hypothetical protein
MVDVADALTAVLASEPATGATDAAMVARCFGPAATLLQTRGPSSLLRYTVPKALFRRVGGCDAWEAPLPRIFDVLVTATCAGGQKVSVRFGLGFHVQADHLPLLSVPSLPPILRVHGPRHDVELQGWILSAKPRKHLRAIDWLRMTTTDGRPCIAVDGRVTF